MIPFLATVTIISLIWAMRNQVLALEYKRKLNAVHDSIQAYRRNDGKISPLATLKAIEAHSATE